MFAKWGRPLDPAYEISMEARSCGDDSESGGILAVSVNTYVSVKGDGDEALHSRQLGLCRLLQGLHVGNWD
jgi:hypothetical protein